MSSHMDEGYHYEALIEDEYCEICGALMEPESCWQCHGEGCDEDHYEGEIMVDCEACDGWGHFMVCPNAESHPKEQAT